MQEIIVEKPYQFIPPYRGEWVPSFIQRFRLVDLYLKRFEGIHSHEVRGAEKLKESLAAGHGIILAPNHCRYSDPLAIGWVARAAATHVFAMASWHLFHQHWLQGFAIRMCGGFSVFREGVDRSSLDTAIEILTSAKRPLVIFPEGTVFRTNDRLNPLLDGVSFLARTAAKRRAKSGAGQVVVHPVAIKYLFQGDLEQAVEPILQELETRVTWNAETRRGLTILDRIGMMGEALLSLKEIQFLGQAQSGDLATRKQLLIERILHPLEVDLLGGKQAGALIPRIKKLRSKLVPELTVQSIEPSRRAEIWRKLSEIYVAQQVESYPVGYLDEPTDTRILETVERFEEDVKDYPTIHRPLHAILEVGDPILAGKEAKRDAKHGKEDPLMVGIEESLKQMLNRLAKEANPWP